MWRKIYALQQLRNGPAGNVRRFDVSSYPRQGLVIPASLVLPLSPNQPFPMLAGRNHGLLPFFAFRLATGESFHTVLKGPSELLSLLLQLRVQAEAAAARKN